MTNNRKGRLISLGTEALADALLQLAGQDDRIDNFVDGLIATPSENIHRFKSRMAAVKRSRRFIHWRESAGFARELEDLLEELKAAVEDPRLGCKLIVDFYKSDNAVLGRCDDSSGLVGDLYRYVARNLFVDYGQQCTDKAWLENLIFKLNKKDDFGVRDTLINCAAEYLPESNIYSLISKFQIAAEKAGEESDRHHLLRLVASLARQIRNPKLFEDTLIVTWGTQHTAAYMEIAQAYLESGDAQSALIQLENIPSDEIYMSEERNRLLLDIYKQLGKRKQEAEVAWRIFRRHRNRNTLQELLSVIGEDQRKKVIATEAENILTTERFSLSDAAFLVEPGLTDQAGSYLVKRINQLDGELYSSLIPIAEAMEAAGNNLAATAIYRALLESILERAQTKIYGYGVRYLKKLDQLATFIIDWNAMQNHDSYHQLLRQVHGRKSSFWSKYERSSRQSR